MKRLQYVKSPLNVRQLSDELWAANSTWATVGPDGVRVTDVTIEERGSTVTLTVPDAQDEMALAALINAHVPSTAYGTDRPLQDAYAYLTGTIWPIVRTTPAGTLTAQQTANTVKSLLVVLGRMKKQLYST